MDIAIDIKNLTKKFRGRTIIDQMNLQVPSANIYALIGPNGAGKSTLIKTLVNLYKPDTGCASLLGVDSAKLGPAEFQSIAYVSEDQDMPEWMTIGELIEYCKPFYPGWDTAFCEHLLFEFALARNLKIKELSRGMKMKAVVLCALAFRPRLLVLDEPFSGFDPAVKQELIGGVLDITNNEGWTVLISSHDMVEVEKLAGQVGILKEGRLVVNGRLDDIQEKFRGIEVFTKDKIDLAGFAWPKNWTFLAQEGRMVRFFDSDFNENSARSALMRLFPTAENSNTKTLTLSEIFILTTQNIEPRYK